MKYWYLNNWARALTISVLVIAAHHTATSQDYAHPEFEGAGKLKPEFIKRGKVLYNNHCSGCHGMEGDGNGPGAYGLHPKPRDFTKAGLFKFRSTAMSSIPTDADIERSIREGVPGTSMPSFRLFADNDIKAVAQYLKSFDSSGSWESRPAKVTLPPAPAWLDDESQWKTHAAAGKVTYTQVCSVCHGEKGAGDGVGGQASPVKPADLRNPHDIGSGPELEDAFKAITTGLNGSIMVGYKDSFPEEKRWELVAYIKYLREHRKNPDLTLPEPSATNNSTETSNTSIENEFE